MEGGEVHPVTHVPLAELRARVEEKLMADEAKTDFLESTISSTTRMVQQMEVLLESFEGRIEAMEKNIRPVDDDTSILISQKRDVDKVRQLLSDVEEFYGLASRVQPVLERGPAYQLEEYLKTMLRVDEAVAYFEAHNPENSQLDTLGALRRNGQLKLEEEFRMLLTRYSVAPSPDHVADVLDTFPDIRREQGPAAFDALKACNIYTAVPEETIATLEAILEWLHDAEADAQCQRSFIKIRSGLLEAIVAFAEKTAARPAPVRAPRPSVANPNRVNKALNRTSSFLRKSKHDPHAAARARRASDVPSAHTGPESIATAAYHTGDHPIMQPLRATLLSLYHERQLVRAVVQDRDSHTTIMRGLTVPLLEKINRETTAIVSNAEAQLEKNNFFPLLHVFDLVEQFEDLSACFCTILSDAGADMPRRYHAIHLGLAELGRKILFRFQDSINNDSSKKLPEDGTVHELTSRALKFVTELLAYSDAAGTTLRTDLGSAQTGLSWLGGEGARTLIADWLHGVLTALQSNLARKGKSYSSSAVAAVFKLNNCDYILRLLRSDQLSEVIEHIPSECSNFETLIEEAVKQYRDATWRDVLTNLAVEPVSGALSKKERDAIKEKYTAFNEGFESIMATQRELSIPSRELCDRLRQNNISLIRPAFEQFNKAYANTGFSQKNPQKYLKYEPADVEGMLKGFFSASGL